MYTLLATQKCMITIRSSVTYSNSNEINVQDDRTFSDYVNMAYIPNINVDINDIDNLFMA